MKRRYFVELNRVKGDSIKKAATRLERLGLTVTVLPHKTSLLIERPVSIEWQKLKRILKAILQPKRGSLILFSESTGYTYICQNRGNRPNRLLRY